MAAETFYRSSTLEITDASIHRPWLSIRMADVMAVGLRHNYAHLIDQRIANVAGVSSLTLPLLVQAGGYQYLKATGQSPGFSMHLDLLALAIATLFLAYRVTRRYALLAELGRESEILVEVTLRDNSQRVFEALPTSCEGPAQRIVEAVEKAITTRA